MADIKIKFNLEEEQVELWNGDKKEVAIESEIFQSWVTAYNEKHGYVKPAKVEETTSSEEVTTEGKETTNDESEQTSTED